MLFHWQHIHPATDQKGCTSDRLDRRAAADPVAAVAAFDTAIELREATFRTFAARARG
jgi:hypothetical protein